MPSGYTSGVYEGKVTDVKEFILTCARAFGATIMMKDEPLDTPIPEFKPDTEYHDKIIERAKKDLKKYTNMTPKQIQEEIEIEYQNKVEEYTGYYQERLSRKQRYEDMIVKVKSWQPPSDDHIKLKEFCLNQLRDGIDHDCDLEYYNTSKIKKSSPEEWLQQKIESCNWSIQYHEKSRKQEVDRTNERNLWVNQLKNSFQRI